jgi:hypothetical protein
MTGRSGELPPIPEAIRARLARPTVRLSGPVGHPMVASFFDQLLPVLEVDGSILIELFTDGGDAEIGRRLAEEMRLLRREHARDIWFLGKTLVASAGVTVMRRCSSTVAGWSRICTSKARWGVAGGCSKR